jgi:hypothetical protein
VPSGHLDPSLVRRHMGQFCSVPPAGIPDPAAPLGLVEETGCPAVNAAALPPGNGFRPHLQLLQHPVVRSQKILLQHPVVRVGDVRSQFLATWCMP